MMKKFILLSGLLALTLSLAAVPARRIEKTVTLADGSAVSGTLNGDEYFHWLEADNGQWVIRRQDGQWEMHSPLSDAQIAERRSMAPLRTPQQTATETPLNIAPRGLIIMVNFQDKKFKMSRNEMDSMINGVNYTRQYSYEGTVTSKGSAHQYFVDQSYGQYQPIFDIMGPVTVSEDYSYYGSNNWFGQDSNPEEMVIEACRLVDDSVDFTLYDNNHDGTVDFVYIFYAGYGEADGGSSSTIWPHSFDLGYYYSEKCDGKYLGKYACSNEINNLSKVHDGIGTFCHEFSHVLGLPDLYATNGNSHKTMGAWDILDYGPYNNDGNTPPAYSAYERFFMGWLQPTMLNESYTVTLRPLQDSAAMMVTSTGESNMVGNDPDPSIFYLLENRQQDGWDEHIPGHGLMITKVRYNANTWAGNTVNDTKSSMGVDIIEADGKAPSQSYSATNGYLGKQGDLFPHDTIDFYMKSPFDVYTVTYITEDKEGLIQFEYMGGGDPIIIGNEPPAPTALIDIQGDNRNGHGTRVYDIYGHQVSNHTDALPHGVYIIVTDDKIYKTIL